MPILGSHLDFVKLEARNMRIHQLSAAPASPVTGQLYYDTTSNTLFYYNGTAWVSSSGGTPPDATTTTKGIVQLAGDLAGTAAAPVVAAGAINSSKIADGTITDVDVAAANKDGAVGTPSLRTLGFGTLQAMEGDRTLSQIGVANTNGADIPCGGWKLTNVNDPTNGADAATKNYVDQIATGIAVKGPCQAGTTANIANLAGGAPSTLDGITLGSGYRILVKDQTTAAQNGIYTVTTVGTGSNGTWTRATDMDTGPEFPSAYTWVSAGTVNADTAWVCTNDSVTVGTTPITWVKFASATTIPNMASYYSSATHGAGTTITITQATHGLRSAQGLNVQVQDVATGNVEIPDISVSGTGTVTVTYAASVAANSKRVTIIG